LLISPRGELDAGDNSSIGAGFSAGIVAVYIRAEDADS
jgi:hypothetical protein